MRDALGSLRNLEQLLKSIRVGPRALSAVIPDVHASCAPLLRAARELLAALRQHLPDPGAPDALEAFIVPRVGALEKSLAEARQGPINARKRLALEAAVAGAAQELDAARALIDLLEDALTGPAVRVDLLELVRSAGRTPDRVENDDSATVKATLAAPQQNIELLVNPRLAMWLLGIGVQLMADAGSPTIPHVELTAAECGLRVHRSPGTGESLFLAARLLIAPTLPCARAAAGLGGARFTSDESACTILWPAPG